MPYAFLVLGKQFCIETYCKLAKALYDGGVEGYQLETMNNWEEAVTALEGIKLFKQVGIGINYST